MWGFFIKERIMADTIPNVIVTDTPTKLSTLTATAIADGAACRVKNEGGNIVKFAISAVTPDKTGYKSIPIQGYGCEREFASGENAIWLWVDRGTGKVNAELA